MSESYPLVTGSEENRRDLAEFEFIEPVFLLPSKKLLHKEGASPLMLPFLTALILRKPINLFVSILRRTK